MYNIKYNVAQLTEDRGDDSYTLDDTSWIYDVKINLWDLL